MDSVNVKISTRTGRGKHLIALLYDLAKDGNDIEFDNIPNALTRKAIRDMEAGKLNRVKNTDVLFKELDI